MYAVKLHNENDQVVYNQNKEVWVNFDKFEFGHVPFMTSGKHIPRYEDQYFLVNIYLFEFDNLINKIVEYMRMYDKLP